MIKANDMTLTYPGGKGVFELDFEVLQGEATGYLGPNGSGKTTTIRALLGFMKPDSGTCSLDGKNSWTKAAGLRKKLGYIPGEIAFLDGMNGDEFLTFMARMQGLKDVSRQKSLLEMFELDPKGRIRKFSKGMKQKLGIVTAFMHDPDILILDEPTSGLDPLMQKRFVELIIEEKKRGKTILLSSHIFEEVEKTCDSVIIIRNGRIAGQAAVKKLKNAQREAFGLQTGNNDAARKLLKAAGFEIGPAVDPSANDTLFVYVKGDDIDRFIKTISGMKVIDLNKRTQTLEDLFLSLYGKDSDKS